MELKIKNFQSIADADLEFPKGSIVCIQGESNNGKTAILRAIRALVLNPQGSSHYIQHGKNKAEVTLTNNGNTLTWERTKSTTNYKFNGEEFTKCSKQSSLDFCDLGFVVDSKGKLLNLSGEWDVLYPFYMSDTEFFKHLEDLFAFTDTGKILDGMKGDENSCNRDKLLTQDKLNNMIDKEAKISELVSKIGDNKSSMIKQVLKKKFEDLKRMKEDLKSLERTNTLNNFQTVSEPFNTTLLSEMIKVLSNMYKDGSWLSNRLENITLPQVKNFNVGEYLNNLSNMKKSELACLNEQNSIKVLQTNQIELEKTLGELKERYNSIETCPLCGGEWKGNK